MLAEETISARDREWNYHAIARSQILDLGSGTSSTLTSVTPFQQTAFMRLSFLPLAPVLQIPSLAGHWQGMIPQKPARPIPSLAHGAFRQSTFQSFGFAQRVDPPRLRPRQSP